MIVAPRSCRAEQRDPELTPLVRPQLVDLEAALAHQPMEPELVVLVRRLRPDGLAGGERYRHPEHMSPLRCGALEVHLHAARVVVPDGAVPEGAKVEVGIELAVEASERIEVERCRDAITIVV